MMYNLQCVVHLQWLIDIFIMHAREWGGGVVALLRNTRGGHQLCYDLLQGGEGGSKMVQKSVT